MLDSKSHSNDYRSFSELLAFVHEYNKNFSIDFIQYIAKLAHMSYWDLKYIQYTSRIFIVTYHATCQLFFFRVSLLTKFSNSRKTNISWTLNGIYIHNSTWPLNGLSIIVSHLYLLCCQKLNLCTIYHHIHNSKSFRFNVVLLFCFVRLFLSYGHI